MLLAREFVDYISRQTIRKLSPQWIETTDLQVAGEFMAAIIDVGRPLIGAVTGTFRLHPRIPILSRRTLERFEGA